jgi:hypothetical protein
MCTFFDHVTRGDRDGRSVFLTEYSTLT